MFALATGLFMVFVISNGRSLADASVDPYRFGEMGKSIAEGNGFEGFGSLITRRAPFYPLLIGAVYFALGEHTNLVLLLHCFLFAGTALLAFDLGRRVFNERTGVLAGIGVALHPMFLRFLPVMHLETLLTFLFTLHIWATVRLWEKPSLGRAAFAGLVAGAATLTKAVVLLYPILFVLAWLLISRAKGRHEKPVRAPWPAFVVLLVAMGLTILPWTIRNYQATGHFVLVSSGTSDAFLRGFIFSRPEFITLQQPPYTDAENESNAYFQSLARAEGTEWEKDDYETDQILNAEARRRLFHEPEQVVRKSFVGLFTFWYEMTNLKNSLLAGVLAIGAWAFALLGWRRARGEQRASWMLLLPVFYLNIILAVLLALGRYSVPILPSLLVVAAFGADSVLNRWRPSHG